jgi:proline iminopeptidase
VLPQKVEDVVSHPFDIHHALKKLLCKTLIVHGDQDPIPVSTAENLHKSIERSTFVVIEECGHFPYVEKPEGLF